MSRAANLKREGKESVWARRRREREEFEERMRRMDDEERRKSEEEVAEKLELASAGKDDTEVKETDAQKLNGIKQPPTNKELGEQIKHNTGLIGRLTDQIGELAGGVEALVGLVGQHDQALGEHGRRISELEKATGILDPKPESESDSKRNKAYSALLQDVLGEDEPELETAKSDTHYGYLYFPVDKHTGKIRWDLPFRNSVDAADCEISCSWRRRLFCFNADGKFLREATPEEASKFSCGA